MDGVRRGAASVVAVLAVLAVVVVVLLPRVAASAPATHAAADGCDDRGRRLDAPRTGAIFNDPTGDASEQYRILSEIRKDIVGTPPGEEIRIASLAINAKAVVEALTEANRCGVHVRVLVPGRAWDDRSVLALRKALGADRSANSFIARCEGSCTSDGDGGIMHVKSYLFSKVRGARNVSVYSSSNLTRSQATERWNDGYQLVGNRAVYSSAVRFFDTLTEDAAARFPRLTKTEGYWQYYFPSRRDFHLDLLEATTCETASGPTSVELVASIWKRVAVADELADLRDAGCDVRVALNLDRVERPVLQALHDRGVPTRVQSVDGPEGAPHSKYVAIRGMHDGYVVRTVFTGSTNVSGFSSQTANNNMIRIVDDRAAYAAYHREFGRLWEASRPLRRADVDSAGRVDARAAERRD